ncbi:hypothetical protein K3495_g12392 [Podosphaera aphanis]|nr:hypothetical protein K3495_g12392 [Podosphaera aphanis]
MENDAFIKDDFMDDDFIDAAFMDNIKAPILLPSLTPETFSPLMLDPYGHAIYQRELPFPQGQHDVFAPEIFSLPTTPVTQQELPFLQGQDSIFVPESPLPFPDETLEFAEIQSQPDLSELPNGLTLFTPENGFVEFLNPAQVVVPEVAPQPQRRRRSREMSKLDRVAIKTARRSGLFGKEIAQRFGYTEKQVYCALKSSVNPRKYLCGGKSAIPLDMANQIVEWIRRCRRNRIAP